MNYSIKECEIHKELIKNVGDRKLVIICIGTDRAIGDAYAPYIGTLLKANDIEDVYGTLDKPIHALNIKDRLEEIYSTYEGEDVAYLSIDACLIKGDRSGREPLTMEFRNKPIKPGKGVGKELGRVGDFSIVGHVGYNMRDFNEMRLSDMIGMSEDTACEILKFYELKNKLLTSC